ncbi:helix-turn-helix transcriptional regulator [Streptomycetaceae bacterium NBC_01309]
MPPKRLDGSVSALAFFGSELRFWRERAGMSQEALAERVFCSPSLVAYIEHGMRSPSEEFAQLADAALGTGGALTRILPLVRRSGFAAYFEDVARLEREAKELCFFETMVVPGLLQTEAYARSLLRAGLPDDTDGEVEVRVRARMERQQVLTAAGNAPKVWFVIDESVLLRAFAGREVMREQLAHILDMGSRPGIVVQVLAMASEPHAALAGGGGELMVFEEGADIAYIEGMSGGHAFTDPAIVSWCARQFDLLRAVALSPQQSAKVIRQAMEAL